MLSTPAAACRAEQPLAAQAPISALPGEGRPPNPADHQRRHTACCRAPRATTEGRPYTGWELRSRATARCASAYLRAPKGRWLSQPYGPPTSAHGVLSRSGGDHRGSPLHWLGAPERSSRSLRRRLSPRSQGKVALPTLRTADLGTRRAVALQGRPRRVPLHGLGAPDRSSRSLRERLSPRSQVPVVICAPPVARWPSAL